MGEIKVNRISGSTLTEVVLAMALLGIVTAAALSIFSNLNHSTSSVKVFQVSSFLDSEINKTFQNQLTKDQSFTFENFEIEIQFTEHLSNKNLKLGIFSAYVPDEKIPIVEKKILIRKN